MDRISRHALVLAVVCGVLAVFSGVWLARADGRLLDQVPKRLAQGRALRVEHHMALGFRRAAWAGLVVGLAGAATVGWWGRREAKPAACDAAGARFPAEPQRTAEVGVLPSGWLSSVSWREVAVVGLLAMAASGALRWPRLGHSFWSDEAYAARVFVWGVKSADPDGALVFKPVSWRDALFLNERANNQVWCSIEARMAHAIWRAVGGHPADTFSERALRMPSFLWGLLTVGAVAALGAMVAGRGGTAAGLLLAVHPWHVRFAAEMRGYSAMLLALTLGIVFLLVALRDGKWRWWLLSAAMNLWALLAFAGSAYVPLVVGAAAAGWLVWRRRWDWLARLTLANALAAVAFLWIYGPSITQLSAFLQRGTDVAAYTVTAAWLRQFGESLCLGVPWSVMSATWQEATWLPSASAAVVAVAVVACLFLLRGVLAVLVQARLLAIPALLTAAALLSIAQSVAAGSLLLMWYLLPLVIGWVLVLGAGPLGARPSPTRNQEAPAWPRWCTWVFPLSVLVCLGLWTSVSVAMVQIPRQPMREAAWQSDTSVPWLGVRLYPDGPEPHRPTPAEANDFQALKTASTDAVLAVMGISDLQMKLYAPGVIVLKSMADLENAEATAAHQRKPLWVSVGGWLATEERMPEATARLTGGTYEKIADLPGWEPMFSYQVWRRR